MRLIDADALREEHCEDCKPDIQEDCKYDPICASLIWVHDARTVDAIPVEQVARMLRLLTDSTCPVEFMGIDKNAWCDENCDSYEKDCWLHAIREGWLE